MRIIAFLADLVRYLLEAFYTPNFNAYYPSSLITRAFSRTLGNLP